MNRSILIVICDFLLVSLLVFSSVDINKVSEEGRTQPIKLTIATNQVDAGTDLAAVMKLALADEQKRRESLLGELNKSRETTSEREKRLETAQQRLNTAQQRLDATQQQLNTTQQRLDTTQQQLESSQQRLQSTEQQRTGLEQQLASAQTNIETLSQQVQVSSADATISKEKLAAMEAELRKRAEEAAALQQRLANLAQSNQMALNEKQKLANQLQIAEVEKRNAAEQVVSLRDQVKVEREEKAKLTEGIKALATNSTQLVQEIRENRPLSPNTIFNEFIANRVQATFDAFRSGLFDKNKRGDTGTVLVTDGTNMFALCHVEETPLTFLSSGTQWDSLTGTLSHGTTNVPIRAMSFHLEDPRVVLIPVAAAETQRLGAKVYHISTTPFKFQDVVLVGASGGYYGECKFEIDLTAPAYVKLDRSLLRGLFGKFNPSRGDLVFSKTGDLLGIMANDTYCLLIHNFGANATIRFGQDVRAQNTGYTLSALYTIVQQMPPKLQ
jgi:hypothetical protein